LGLSVSLTRSQQRTALWLLAGTLATFALGRLLDVRHGLNAVYFSGVDWAAGASQVTGVDALPSTEVLKARRPDFAGHAFSVEWRGFLVVLRSSTYTFSTLSKDGSWVYVRGQLVVDNPGRHDPQEAQGTIALPAGVYPIFLRYFEDGGDCALQVRWARQGGALESVPASAFLPERAPYWRVLGRRVTEVALKLIAILWGAVVVLASARWAVQAAGRRGWSWRDKLDPAILSVLLLSGLLNLWGIWFGLPNERGWSPDELVPTDVLDALGLLFSHGWADKYPPFHYALLSVAYGPMLLLSWLGVVDLRAAGPHLVLFLIGRGVSAVLGLGTVLVVYWCGRELYGRLGAALAALTTALMLPFAYYAKMTNLDVPYLFWFAVSLLAYVRILKHHRRGDYLLFAASAALAVGTKDQAYALFVLPTLAILIARWRRSHEAGGAGGPIVFDRTTLLAAAVGVGTFLLADNVLFNFGGFVEHVKLIVGPASARFQMFPATVAGQLQMAWLALLELRYIFGWPLAVIVAMALVGGLATTSTTVSLRWLLVPVISYYVAFIGVILYFYDRFLLPIGLVLSLFAGYGLARFLAPAVQARRLRLALVGAAFAYSVIYVANVDYALTTDSRYTVTRWLTAHARPDQMVGAAGGNLQYFALADPFFTASTESMEAVTADRPAFIVVNPDQMASLPRQDPARVMHDALLDGRAGYTLALRYRAPALPLPGRHPDLGDASRDLRFSSLGFINPTLEVFERNATATPRSAR
jgi:4-amino-4-deoxy-L-arabinose transferase-like glycosyltransferase